MSNKCERIRDQSDWKSERWTDSDAFSEILSSLAGVLRELGKIFFVGYTVVNNGINIVVTSSVYDPFRAM